MAVLLALLYCGKVVFKELFGRVYLNKLKNSMFGSGFP